MENTVQRLEWRYATKKFDTTKKLSSEQEHTLHEALRLSASSFGLQPWKFVVVKNKELREELRKHAWGQAQVTDASELIVICTPSELTEAHVDTFINHTAKVRNIPVDALKGYHDMLLGSIKGRTKEGAVEWAARQAYIALGTLLTTAAIEHIDAAPMEGFDKKKFDETLGLHAMGLTSQVLCAVGFRAHDDKDQHMKKVRFDANDVFIMK